MKDEKLKAEDLIGFLKDDSVMTLSNDEVERIMDEELEKEPENIDAALVEACLDFLSGSQPLPEPKAELLDKIIAENNRYAQETEARGSGASRNTEVETNVKTKIFKLKPLLAAAIAAVLLAVTGVTAFAAYNPEFKDSVVSFFADHAAINYSEKKSGEKAITAPKEDKKLYKELKEGGITDIVLPNELYDIKHKKLNWQSDEITKSVHFVSHDKDVSVTIQTFSDKKYIMNPDIQGQFTAYNKINVNGIDVFLFERDGGDEKKASTTISYQVGLTQYSINYNYSIDKAEEFIKSMN